MLSLRKLVVVVLLPLMFGAIVLAGLQQMKSDQLNIWQENARQDINQEARHIVIGQNTDGTIMEQDKAKEQFRDLVIYSQISGVNCQLLYWIHGSIDNESGDARASEYMSGSFWPNKIDQNSRYKIKYSIPSRWSSDYYRLFNYLERSNYVPTCVGVDNEISSHLVDKRIKALRNGNMLNAAWQFTVGTLVGGLEDFWNMINCKQEPSWLSNRGNDMEGRYGRITFEAETTFFPGKNSGNRNKIWSAQFLNEIGNCPADNEEFIGPEFFQANEWMDYLPNPDEKTPEEANYGVNGNSPNLVEHQSAESDAIIDAPALTDEKLRYLDPEEDYSSSGAEGGTGYGDFPRRYTWYVICEGASGYVQTNANAIWNNGEAVWGKDNKIVGEYRGFESRAFTFVEIEENKTSCLNNVKYTGNNVYIAGEELEGEDCSTLEDANEGKTVTYYTTEYECMLRRYRWNHDQRVDGEVLKHIYQIGWVSVN